MLVDADQSGAPDAWHDVLAAGARRRAPDLVVVALSLLFRLPVLLNAAAVNSDGAAVGLQAMHMLHGEWSWILWGAPYQAPGDSLVAALFFAVLGTRPLALVLVPVLGQVVVAWTTLVVLRRSFARWPAVWWTLPVVFTPMALDSYLLYIQRQLCITVFVVSVAWIDGARDSKRPRWNLALGAWLGILTLYLDLYAIQWVVPVALLTIACAAYPGMRWRSYDLWARVASGLGGLAAGLLTVRVARSFCPPTHGQVSASIDNLPHNLDLLTSQALPWALGTKIFAVRGNLYPDLVHVPWELATIQWAGAIVVVSGMASAAAFVWVRSIPWRVRRLGLFALSVVACSLGGFLVSGMPADMWSTRYLAPILLVMPFGLAPMAYWIGRRAILLTAPYVAAAAVNGWIGYGTTYVDGFLPARSARGSGEEEQRVGKLLRDHGVEYAAAQYWLSYRLTFLFRENPIVVPLSPGDDRYAPYRAGFDRARDVAYIFHPSEPRAQPQDVETRLRTTHASYERFKVADFTVLIEHRLGGPRDGR